MTVYLVPGLLLVLGLAIIYVGLRGIRRTTQLIDDVPVGKWSYEASLGSVALRAGLLLVFLSIPALAVVPPGHRGVVYTASGGVSMAERDEGISFILPYLSSVKMVDVREQKFFTPEAFAQSVDLQEITVHVAVGYRVDPTQAAEIYQAVGPNYGSVVLEPLVFQLVKQEVGLIKAEDFAANRATLALVIQTGLQERVADRGLAITYVSIVDAVFDPAFITAVKEKVIADQEAAEQVRLVAAETAKKDQIEQQALAQQIRLQTVAAGEAEAIRLVAESLGFTPEQYLAWKTLEKWNGNLPTTLVGGAGQFGLLLNVGTETQ